MSRINSSTMLAVLSLWPLPLALPAAANAAPHSEVANATGPCNGALPAYEGALRKRPLGLVNEGDRNAFVSCSLQSDSGENPGFDLVVFYFVNRNASSAVVDCTMVSGGAVEVGFEPTYHPKTLGIPANAAGTMLWEAADYDLPTFHYSINASCNLPPGVEMARMGGTYESPDPA